MPVKRQFMHVPPTQKPDQPMQHNRAAVPVVPLVAQATWQAPAQQTTPPGGGLLTRYKTGTLSPPLAKVLPPGMRVMSPVTGEATNTAPFGGSVSPHQSGITPQAQLFLRSQVVQRPVSQALLPQTGYASRPLPPPLHAPAPMPGMPPGYPSGPPLLVQPSLWQEKRRKKRFPVWARIILSVILMLLVTAGGVAGYYYYTLSSTLNGTVGQTVAPYKGDSNPNPNRSSSGGILSGGRINILLLGSDTDQKFNGAYLAQTDIVVTIDPVTKSIGMLSIPRDTWLNVPDHGMMKLDEAFSYGGVALSRATIHQAFGIYIDYYAWVGLDGFVKVIDTVGGVDVDVLHPIVDDSYPDDVANRSGDIYALKRLYLTPGPQHLSGADALEYVRSRHADLVGDFGRSTRQQQVLTQLKTKLNNPALIGKVQELANDLTGYVKTDMQLNEVLELMNFARSLDLNKIKRVTLGAPYSSLKDEVTAGGTKSVVILDCNKIRPLIAQMFGLGDNAVCNTGVSSVGLPALSHQPLATAHSTPQLGADQLWQLFGQMAHLSALNRAGSVNDPFGVHSLLDLLFLVVFESPLALQV